MARREKDHTASSEALQRSPFLPCVCVHFSTSNRGSNAPFFTQTCFSMYILHLTQSLPTSLPTSCSQFIFFNSFPNFKISYSEPLNLSESCYPSSWFFFILFPLIPGSQRVLFRRGVVGVQGGWQQGWDRGLGSGRRGVGWRLMLMEVVVVVVMVVMVDRRAVVWDDGRGCREDIGSRGRSRRGRVASGHAGVGRGSSP